jgi:hypothetical protein
LIEEPLEEATKCSSSILLIERMGFNNPYKVILFLLCGDAIYIASVYLGNPTNRMFTWMTFITVQFEIIYFAFFIRAGINKIREFLDLEIDKKTDSPLQSLFISKNEFFKYKNQIVDKIFKWQMFVSILFFVFWLVALYFSFTSPNESPVFGRGGLVWNMLRVSYYLIFLGIMAFISASFFWALLCIIFGLRRLNDAKGLKIRESIKTFKTWVKIKQNNEYVVIKKSLEGYHTYNRFVTDAGKITEFLLFFASGIAIVAIPISVNWIVIEGLIFHNWVWYNIAVAIFWGITAIIIVVFPLFSIHGILKAAKSEISNIINEVYEHNKIYAVIQSASFSKIDEGLIKNMTCLKGIVDEVNSLKTWPIDLESIIRLTAIMYPIVLLVISKIVERIVS